MLPTDTVIIVNDSYARPERARAYQIDRFKAKLTGAEERKAKAQAKRDRKNEKRVRDAYRSEIGQRLAREQLDGSYVLSTSISSVAVEAFFPETPFNKLLAGVDYGAGEVLA
ncbi:hypothetical protein [Bradyrhizobium sp. Tv2a-2]|uniref:hypothetical protein n=1 Tax=Bradyrhizobium sp. Tv2a-2 TaxID=113395 RepID=UPI0004230895|nr:hypothetical protein [Bradyrhizobium sp. Tv2a-2]